MLRTFRYFLLCLLAAWAIMPRAFAIEAAPSLFQTNRDIHVEATDKTGDLTCFHCSIYIHGATAGDVTALGGNIVVYQGGQLAGDITSLFGNVHLENGAQAAGDVTAMGGNVRRDPQALIAGDITSMSQTEGIVVLVVIPLFVLGGIIALVVWLIQRNRRTAPVPTAVHPPLI